MSLSRSLCPDDVTCPHALFENLPNGLQLQEPRAGYMSRAHVITDWLHHRGFITGRAWVFPRYGTSTFDAPLYDLGGAPLEPLQIHEDRPTYGARPYDNVRWLRYVAATAESESGPVVFDPTLFDGPVSLTAWQNRFAASPVRFDWTNFWEQKLSVCAPSSRPNPDELYLPFLSRAINAVHELL